jgi:hypothetical protein
MDLYSLDMTNAAATFIVSTNTVGLRGLAIDPTTGKFYSAYGATKFTEKRGIVEINPTTGAVIDIGGTRAFVGLAFDLAGQLYGVENAGQGETEYGCVYRINKSNGSETLLATVPGDPYGPNLSYDSSRDILFFSNFYGNLSTVEPASGAVTFVGTVTVPWSPPAYMHSLEFDEKSNVYYHQHPCNNPDDGCGDNLAFADASKILAPKDIGSTGLHVWDLACYLPIGAPTLPGEKVSVTPVDSSTGDRTVTITFSDVVEEGLTYVSSSSSGLQPPLNFQLGNPPVYYEIDTTANFSGPVTVCIDYTGVSFRGRESRLALAHWEDPDWVDRTISRDPAKNIICAQVTTFSPFAVFEPAVIDVEIDIKPGSYPNSINLGANGVVPVAILSSPEFDAGTVDPTTVTLSGATVELRGKGAAMASLEDVNGDGLADLVVHVAMDAFQLTTGSTVAILTGQTYGEVPVQGVDTVRIVQ